MQLMAKVRNTEIYVTSWVRNPDSQKKIQVWDLTASKDNTFRLDNLETRVDMWAEAKICSTVWTYASANFIRQQSSKKGVLPKLYDRVIALKPLPDSYYKLIQYVDGFPQLDSLPLKFYPPLPVDIATLATIQHWRRYNSTQDKLFNTPDRLFKFIPSPQDEIMFSELDPTNFSGQFSDTTQSPILDKKQSQPLQEWVLEKGVIVSPAKRKSVSSPSLKPMLKIKKTSLFKSPASIQDKKAMSILNYPTDSLNCRAGRGRSKSLSFADPHQDENQEEVQQEFSAPMSNETLMGRAAALSERRPPCPNQSIMLEIEDQVLAVPQVKPVDDFIDPQGIANRQKIERTSELEKLRRESIKIKKEIVDKEFELQFQKHALRRNSPALPVDEHELICISDSDSPEKEVFNEEVKIPISGEAKSSVLTSKLQPIDVIQIKLEKGEDLTKQDLQDLEDDTDRDIKQLEDSDQSMNEYLDDSNSSSSAKNLCDSTFHNPHLHTEASVDQSELAFVENEAPDSSENAEPRDEGKEGVEGEEGAAPESLHTKPAQ